jgi:hypothetical protein
MKDAEKLGFILKDHGGNKEWENGQKFVGLNCACAKECR